MRSCGNCGQDIYWTSSSYPGIQWFHHDSKARSCWWGTFKGVIPGVIAEPELTQARLI